MRNTYLILSFILMLSIVDVFAQHYGTPYTPSRNQTVAGSRVSGDRQNAYSVSSPSFSTTRATEMAPAGNGPHVPLSPVGATMAPQFSSTTSTGFTGPRRIIGGGDEDDEGGEGGGQTGGDNGKPENQDDPYATPLGDAAIPLMLLALMYVCARAFHKKRA